MGSWDIGPAPAGRGARARHRRGAGGEEESDGEIEPDVEAAGAQFVDSDVVVDGTMVSARAWPDHPSWMRQFLRLLREKAPAPEPDAGSVRWRGRQGEMLVWETLLAV